MAGLGWWKCAHPAGIISHMTQLIPDMPTVLDLVPADPDDPYYKALEHAHDVLFNLRKALPHKRAVAIQAHFEGCNGTEIARRAGYAKPPPVATWLKDKFSPLTKFYQQLHRIHAIRSGPTVEQRKHMLWQIAKDNAKEAPTQSIKAIDVLNRMEGIYQLQEDVHTGATVLRFNPDNIDFTQMQAVIAVLDDTNNNKSTPKLVEGKRVE